MNIWIGQEEPSYGVLGVRTPPVPRQNRAVKSGSRRPARFETTRSDLPNNSL